MATIKNVTNIDGKSAVYDFVGNSEETKPAGANIGENSTFTELDTGNQFYRKGNTWATMKAPGGSSSGGSLPANFPTESAANANKFVGFDANGDYEAKNAPSSDEKFFVQLTYDDNEGEWSANKTFAQIVAADAADKIVIVKAYVAQLEIELEFAKASVFSAEGDGGALFYALYCDDEGDANFYSVTCQSESGTDAWSLNRGNNQKELPPVSLLDNGKILGVSGGSLAWVEPAMIVNLTLDGTGETPVLVGNKTFGEIATARMDGKNVLFNYEGSEGSSSSSLIDCIFESDEILVYLCSVGEIVRIKGNSTDYFALNIG